MLTAQDLWFPPPKRCHKGASFSRRLLISDPRSVYSESRNGASADWHISARELRSTRTLGRSGTKASLALSSSFSRVAQRACPSQLSSPSALGRGSSLPRDAWNDTRTALHEPRGVHMDAAALRPTPSYLLLAPSLKLDSCQTLASSGHYPGRFRPSPISLVCRTRSHVARGPAPSVLTLPRALLPQRTGHQLSSTNWLSGYERGSSPYPVVLDLTVRHRLFVFLPVSALAPFMVELFTSALFSPGVDTQLRPTDAVPGAVITPARYIAAARLPTPAQVTRTIAGSSSPGWIWMMHLHPSSPSSNETACASLPHRESNASGLSRSPAFSADLVMD